MASIYSRNKSINRVLICSEIWVDEWLNLKIFEFPFKEQLENGVVFPIEELTHISPETYETGEYNEKTDVYSYSIILYMMLTGEIIPYKKVLSPIRLLNDINVNGERPYLSDKQRNLYIGQLIEACWHHNPEVRPTFREIVQYFQTEESLVYPGCDWKDLKQSLFNI